jgi:hypothetical protein
MPVGASHIVLYGSATMPDSDADTTVGGAIDTQKKVVMTEIVTAGLVEILSDTGGDAQTLDITYRTGAGVSATELQTLNGATVVAYVASMERILKAVASTSVHGQITIRKASAGTNLATLPNGVIQVRRPFFKAEAPTAGTKSYYDKIFIKNNHGTLALLGASILESADPSALITFALDGVDAACPLSLNVNNGAGNDRNTPPSARVSTFSSATKTARNSGDINPGSAQGVWLRLLLTNTDAATKTSYTLQTEGGTT